MLVSALIEYSMTDSEYIYIERWDKLYKRAENARRYWRISLMRNLLERGIVSNNLKVIEVEYEEN